MSNQSKGRPGGVLPINAAATKKTSASQKPAQRSPAPKLRLIIRRLPPGLTEAEFWEALGLEWQTGNGKVDWHAFKEGKVSKDPSKPSTPGRAYLRVKDQLLLDVLSNKVKSTIFKDAKNTSSDPCLIGPPSLEYAPYNKVPTNRNRHDSRQGTIDQDPEFIDFLQSLTEPITKPATNGSEAVEGQQEKVVTTPLVQFIKEKKANKAKEKEAAAAAKSAKKNQEGKEGKSKGESRPTVVVKSSTAGAEKARVAKATQEAVKAANKSASQIQSKAAPSKPEPKAAKESSTTTTTPSPAPTSTPTSKPERQRGSVSAASKLIARDLGLAPKEPRTPRAARNASAAASSTTQSNSKTEAQQKLDPHASTPVSTVTTASAPAPVSTTTSTPAPATASKASTSVASTTPAQTPPTGPRNNRSAPAAQQKPTPTATQHPSKASPQPSPGAKSAFLKHANPSQGVTEELLRTSFSAFGEVTRCEIDKKKGLGYVDFTETEALKKAMAASPIKVGNGQVVVLENRSPYQKRQAQPANTGQQQTGTGAKNSRAASAVSSAAPSAVTSPQPAPAVIATVDPALTSAVAPPNAASEVLPATEAGDSPATQTTSTPTAPTGGRGGSNNNNNSTTARGGRGGSNANSGRGGGANQTSNRGRGGFRGGRGRSGNKAGGNAAAAAAAASGSTPSTPTPSGTQGGNSGDNAKPAATSTTTEKA